MSDESIGRMSPVKSLKPRSLEEDLQQTVRDLKSAPPMKPPKSPEDFAPPAIRDRKTITDHSAEEEKKDYSTLQAIAFSITKLTWKQAENMGAAIHHEMKDDKTTGSQTTGSLTAAIQAWAEGWEKFEI